MGTNKTPNLNPFNLSLSPQLTGELEHQQGRCKRIQMAPMWDENLPCQIGIRVNNQGFFEHNNFLKKESRSTIKPYSSPSSTTPTIGFHNPRFLCPLAVVCWVFEPHQWQLPHQWGFLTCDSCTWWSTNCCIYITIMMICASSICGCIRNHDTSRWWAKPSINPSKLYIATSDIFRKFSWGKHIHKHGKHCSINRGHYTTNPNNARLQEFPQKYHIFALFDPPKWVF